MFTVEICYRAGSSCSSTEETKTVGMVWKTLAGASAALRAIQAHDQYCRHTSLPRPIPRRLPSWYVPVPLRPKELQWAGSEDAILFVIDDAGKPRLLYVFWHGYFDRLLEAKVVLSSEIAYRPERY